MCPYDKRQDYKDELIVYLWDNTNFIKIIFIMYVFVR